MIKLIKLWYLGLNLRLLEREMLVTQEDIAQAKYENDSPKLRMFNRHLSKLMGEYGRVHRTRSNLSGKYRC